MSFEGIFKEIFQPFSLNDSGFKSDFGLNSLYYEMSLSVTQVELERASGSQLKTQTQILAHVSEH